jgi:uncharacterized iron-regulated membrane protein
MTYDKDKERLNAEQYNTAQENVRQNARREDTAALSGATLGILLALAIAGATGAFFFFNSRNEVAPTAPAVSPSTVPSTAVPEKQTIIREETVRELVPVPQTTTQPNINITVPSQAPAAPSPAATSPAAKKNTLPSSGTQSAPQAEPSNPSPTN